jgi:prophage antirepressor-like protein
MSVKKDNVFFMEIFNEILKINNNDVIIIFDGKGDVWFGLRDIVKLLQYNNVKNAITKLKISKTNVQIYSKISEITRGTSLVVPHYTHQPHKKFINESGLYELLSISTKPLAKIFMDKYFTEIMPKIRQHGIYQLDKTNKTKLDKVNKKLTSIKKSNKSLLNNQRNVTYPVGNAIYVITKIINKKKYYKIGYTKNLNKRLKVYNTGEPNKILFNYYLMVKDKKIDSCIKKIMKNEEFIKNKEYYMTTLNKILKFISKCDITLNKINCGYCLELYDFDNIKDHKCKYI